MTRRVTAGERSASPLATVPFAATSCSGESSFAGYHLHVAWAIPGSLLDMFTLACPTKRYRSACIGIAVHSAQTVFLGIFVLTLVV